MSSILTNTSAMVALQTMKSINSGLNQVQSEISTGKSVANAKDNAAVWAISKTMESDVSSFESISDSLSLGQSTVAVARTAAETVTNLLTEMKTKIVAAQGENVDRGKMQTDISALKEQIQSVVGAAQFNGLNLVQGGGGMNVLSSLDRGANGVSATSIAVGSADLRTGGYTPAAAFTGSDGASAGADVFGFTMDAGATGTVAIDAAVLNAGDSLNLTIGGKPVSYTVTQADKDSTSAADVIANGVKKAIEAAGLNVSVDYDSANAGELVLTNDGAGDIAVSGQFRNAGSGGLSAMTGIDVSTDAAGALAAIEGLITTATDAAASFGSAEKRLSMQGDFVSKLTDAMKTGIGSMVDANMEEASARLQALQVQQQLGVQSLSIANQSPQSILSLFR
ncbi:flagellin [Falsirhodobacter halotolerans]|uniref:flagellin n=1 Tax=Falsirhodobacter halotolerans TaxID=1146892 RepID=UPI001FD0DD01|nr:flagellin [Falsirhodobacter halotolerans]MCJ8140570.1 flagellin [Falsirhodobacter halotolerans]